MKGRAPRPATELMLTMRPRAALSRGRKACVTATAPIRFTSKTWRSWSRGTSSRGPADGMPALLTSAASGAPASARATSSRARAMLAASVTSISTGTTCAAPLEAAHVVPVLMDVTDAAGIARARDEVARALAGAPLAALVNNAGIPSAGPLELVPLDQLRHVLEVNLIGAVAVTQAFLPLLKAARGRIVNISSVAGRGALPFMGPYAASKFALEGASDSLRRELRPFGVRVIVVQPGSVQSRIWEKVERWDLSRYRGTPYERVLERFRDLALRSGQRGLPADRVARAVA